MLDDLLQSCNLMLIETVAKQPFSFQVVPFDSPRNHITIHVRMCALSTSLSCDLLYSFIHSFSPRSVAVRTCERVSNFLTSHQHIS